MIYENFKHLTTDRTIKSIIGMSRGKFDGLVSHFSAAYQKIQEERYQNKEIKWLPKGGKPGVFSSHEERLNFCSLLSQNLSDFRYTWLSFWSER